MPTGRGHGASVVQAQQVAALVNVTGNDGPELIEALSAYPYVWRSAVSP